MDAWIRNRLVRWLGRLLAMLSLVVSCGSQGNEWEFTAPLPGIVWYIVSSYPTVGMGGPYASATDACLVVGAIHYNSMFPFKGITGGQLNSTGTLIKDTSCLFSRPPHDVGAGLLVSLMLCPIAKVNPQYSFNFDWNTVTCSRFVPKASLSIALTGGPEVEPSNSSEIKTLPFIATVIDQNGQPTTSPVKVQISVKVDPTSGGHDHGNSARPRGGIANVRNCPSDDECWSSTTDGNGQVVFNFNAPEASGTHTITATCDGCSNTETKSVDVKVDGLEIIPSSSFYTFIGETDKHSDNHYLTPTAASILWRIAVSYQMEKRFKLADPATKKFTVTPPVLQANDASLKWGGKFDLSGGWTGDHSEHRRGTVVDVRANNQSTAIPIENFKEFKSMVADYGAFAFLESPSIGKRHFHLRLLNRKE